MPGTLPNALYTVSHFIFKATLQSNHQYPHFTVQEDESESAQFILCKVHDLPKYLGEAPLSGEGVWLSRTFLGENHKIINLIRSPGLSERDDEHWGRSKVALFFWTFPWLGQDLKNYLCLSSGLIPITETETLFTVLGAAFILLLCPEYPSSLKSKSGRWRSVWEVMKWNIILNLH